MAKAGTKTEEMIDKVVRELARHARAELVFGEPAERNGVTVIPMAGIPKATPRFRPSSNCAAQTYGG